MNYVNFTSHFQSQENDNHQSNCPVSTAGHTESPCIPLTPGFQAVTETECPCCHQVSMEQAFQPPMVIKPGRTGYWLTHCLNPMCAGYKQTLSLEQFTARYATPKENNE